MKWVLLSLNYLDLCLPEITGRMIAITGSCETLGAYLGDEMVP
jgi:hypothetical protein